MVSPLPAARPTASSAPLRTHGLESAGEALRQARTVVVFSAHPDDVDFGAGGTVAALTAAGARVVYVVMTDGDAGGFDDDAHSEIAVTRAEEQRRAAAMAGVTEVLFLGERDGRLEPTHEVIERVVAILREYRPEIVVSPHPERNWTSLHKAHPDHLACGEIVTRAAFPAVENPYAYPRLRERGLEAYRLPWLLLYAGPDHLTNVWVDVTATAQTKLAALDVHLSQHPDPEGMHRTVLGQLADSARRATRTGESRMQTERDDQGSEALAEEFHAVCVNGPDTFAGF